jgi:hypothetical protein
MLARCWLQCRDVDTHKCNDGEPHLKTDPLMDPLRQEPRFQAVMKELKFPS